MNTLLTRAQAEIVRAYPDLLELRRDIHRHPELSRHELNTTAKIAAYLADLDGVRIQRLATDSGLVVDLGAENPARRIGIRADIDALPVPERSGLPFSSEYPDVCHACGHDVHIAVVAGAVRGLAAVSDELTQRGIGVRAIFQPAEEVMPGGAEDIIEAGWTKDLDMLFGVHCDPSIEVGSVGLRVGAITAAADGITVILRGRGGHTSRPHLTEDLTYALAKVITDVPAALSRRIDPRAGLALVWGQMRAGNAANVIPSEGMASGTLRMLDAGVWSGARAIVEDLVDKVVAPYGVTAEIDYARGVPPVVNDANAIEVLRGALEHTGLREVSTAQSLGGEDFTWCLHETPGAMARLGTRTPGGPIFDLHQGDLVVDELAIRHGANLLAAAVLNRSE